MKSLILNRPEIFLIFFLLSILTLICCKKSLKTAPTVNSNTSIKQPLQPGSGYGGSNYSYTAVTKLNYNDGITGFMLYFPLTPHPDSLPVVMFNHGFGEWNPINYGAWINHIILRGNIVIFPIFQTDLGAQSSAAFFTANAVTAYKRAIDTLLSHKNWPQPIISKLFMIGHSYGGVIATDIAANYAGYNMPRPLAFMPVAPGTGNPADIIPSFFNPSIYMLPVIGEDDNVVGPGYCTALYNSATNVPLSHRNLITQNPDSHGSPGLTAVHGECWAVDSSYDNGVSNYIIDYANQNSAVNTVDYYCFWKLFDALEDCALTGNGCTTAFGNTAAQKNMGLWSDGTPAVPLTVTNQ